MPIICMHHLTKKKYEIAHRQPKNVQNLIIFLSALFYMFFLLGLVSNVSLQLFDGYHVNGR